LSANHSFPATSKNLAAQGGIQMEFNKIKATDRNTTSKLLQEQTK
jgi:hypothetical protein